MISKISINNMNSVNFSSRYFKKKEGNAGVPCADTRVSAIDYQHGRIVPEKTRKQNPFAVLGGFFHGVAGNHKAKKFSKDFKRVITPVTTIENFRNGIQEAAIIRDNSIDDFKEFNRRYANYYLHANHLNLSEDEQKADYLEGLPAFGPNTRLQLKTISRPMPNSDERYSCHVPTILTIGNAYDKNDVFYGAEELYHLDQGYMLAGVEPEQDKINIGSVNVLEPTKLKTQFLRFARTLNRPVTINNAVIKPNGDFQAESMSLFTFDRARKLVGVRTYINPEVKYGEDSNGKLRDFTITADSVYDFKNGQTNYFEGVTQECEDKAIGFSSDKALICEKTPKKTQLNTVYTDFYRDDRGILFDSKQTVDLSKINVPRFPNN